jgi:DNA-binding response OmpR family regulator
MTRILLVAPDSDLRKSVEFALRAEGYEVTSFASIGANERASRYDCTVLDHHAIGLDPAVAARFCDVFAPVVLLANQPIHTLSPVAFRTVQKPLLGAALTDAIRDATGGRSATT